MGFVGKIPILSSSFISNISLLFILFRDFMQVFDKIDPGSTDWRAMTLYELALTSTTLAQRKLDKQSYGKDDFRKELQASLKLYACVTKTFFRSKNEIVAVSRALKKYSLLFSYSTLKTFCLI